MKSNTLHTSRFFHISTRYQHSMRFRLYAYSFLWQTSILFCFMWTLLEKTIINHTEPFVNMKTKFTTLERVKIRVFQSIVSTHSILLQFPRKIESRKYRAYKKLLGLLIIKFVMKIWSWCFIFPSRKYKRFSDVRSIKKLLTEMNYTMIYICNEEKYLYTKYRRPTTNALAAASITCVEHSSMRIQYLGNVMASICFSH